MSMGNFEFRIVLIQLDKIENSQLSTQILIVSTK